VKFPQRPGNDRRDVSRLGSSAGRIRRRRGQLPDERTRPSLRAIGQYESRSCLPGAERPPWKNMLCLSVKGGPRRSYTLPRIVDTARWASRRSAKEYVPGHGPYKRSPSGGRTAISTLASSSTAIRSPTPVRRMPGGNATPNSDLMPSASFRCPDVRDAGSGVQAPATTICGNSSPAISRHAPRVPNPAIPIHRNGAPAVRSLFSFVHFANCPIFKTTFPRLPGRFSDRAEES